MNRSLPSLLAPVALCAAAHAVQFEEASVAPAQTFAPGPMVEDGVPARRGSWFPSYGTPDGVMPPSDEELSALMAKGVKFEPAPEPDSILYHDADETGMWLRGRSYKAKASAEGFEYTPFLGSQAPRNFPVHFQLERAVLGGRELPLTPLARVSRHGDRFILDRGAVDVIYDVALDTVEQSFALDVAGSSSDLVLKIDVDTDLAFEAPLAGGFRFVSEFGGMNYGTAVVFDGIGRRADVPAVFNGEQIQLTVPGTFLAQAHGRVIVDPVLSTYSVSTDARDQENPDVAYDRNSDSFIHVYEDLFSFADGDVYFRRFATNGAFVDQGYVDMTTDDWDRPSVANIDFLNRSLIVCERVQAGLSEVEIVGRFFRYSVQALEPTIVIAEPSTLWQNTVPDVGGSWAPSSDGVFIVVWRRAFPADSQVRYRLVRSNGTMDPIQVVSLPSGLSTGKPTISKSSGNPSLVNTWNVAFRVDDANTTTTGIWNLQIAGDGSLLTPPTELLGLPAGQTASAIEVSEGLALGGLDPTYLVSYDLAALGSDEAKPVIVCRGGFRERVVDVSRIEHTAVTGVDTSGIQFATTATDFIMSYLERRSPDDYQTYVTALDLLPFDNLAVSERKALAGTVNSLISRGNASIASRQSGGLTSLVTHVSWTTRNDMNHWDISAARHFANNGTTPALQYCTSAPNSTDDYGFLTMYGDNQLDSDKTLVASFLPPNSVGYFLTGNGFTELMNPGGSVGNLCLAGGSVLGRYSNLAASSGASGTLSLSIDPLALSSSTGTVAATAGSFWQFQCWHRDSVGGVPVSNFTNAVSIRFQ